MDHKRTSLFGGSKETVKVQFDVTIKNVSGFPKSSTGLFYVEWKRGSKADNQGETKKVAVKDQTVTFNETTVIHCTLFKDPKKGFEEKSVVFSVKEMPAGGKKANTMGKVIVDLAEFANSKEERTRTFPLKDSKSKTAVSLILSFKTTWLAENGKRLPGVGSTSNEDLEGDEITDANDITEATHSHSAEEEEDLEDFEDDSKIVSPSTSHTKNRASTSLTTSTPPKTSTLSTTSTANSRKSLPPNSSIAPVPFTPSFPLSPPKTSAVSTTTTTPTVPSILTETSSSNSTPTTTPTITPTTSSNPIPTSNTSSSDKEKKKDKDKDKDEEDEKDLEHKVKKYKKKLKTAQKDLDDLKIQLKEYDAMKDKLKELTDKNEAQEKKISDLQVDLSKKGQSIVDEQAKSVLISKELEEFRNKLFASEKQINETQKKLRDTETELKSAKEKGDKANTLATSQLDSKVSSLNELNKVKAERDALVIKETNARKDAEKFKAERDNEKKERELEKQESLKSKETMLANVASLSVDQKTVTDLRNEVKLLQEKLKTAQTSSAKDLEIKEKAYQELKVNVEKLTKESRDKDNEISRSHGEIEVMEEDIRKKTEELTKLESENAELKKAGEANNALEQIKSNSEKLSLDNKNLQKRVSDLENEKRIVEKELLKLKTESEGLKKQVEQVKTERDRVNADIQKLKSENEGLKNQIQDSGKKESQGIVNLNLEIEQAKSKISTLEENLGKEKKKKQDQEEEINGLLAQIDQIKGSAEKDKKEADEANTKLKEEIKRLKEELNSMESGLESSEIELKEKVRELQEECSTLKIEKSRLEEELNSGVEKDEDYKATISTHKEKVQQLEAKILTLEEDLNDSRSESERANKELKKLKRSIEESEDDVEKRIRKLKSKLENTLQEKEEAEEEVRKLRLELQNGASDQEKDDLVQKLEEEKQTVEELNSKIDKLENENRDLNERLKLSSVNILRGSAKSDESEKESEKLRQRVRELEDELRAVKKEKKISESSNNNSNNSNNNEDFAEASKLRREIEENQRVESVIYSSVIGFDEENEKPADIGGISNCASAVWQLLISNHAFEPINDKLFGKITTALDRSFRRAPTDDRLLCYWASTTSGLLHLMSEKGLIQKSASPVISGVQVDPKKFASASGAGVLARDLQLILYNIFSEETLNITERLQPLLVPAFFEQESVVSTESKPLQKHSTQSPKTQSPPNLNNNTTIGINLNGSNSLNNANGKPRSARLNHPPLPPTHSSITIVLGQYLSYLRENKLPSSLVRQFFSQALYFIDSFLLNHILKNKSLCTPTTGFNLKMACSRMDEWLSKPEQHGIIQSGAALQHLKEASNVLVLDKALFIDADTIISIFHSLNLVQVKKLLDLFTADPMSPGAVPSNVKNMMDSDWGHPTHNLSLVLDTNQLLSYEKPV